MGNLYIAPVANTQAWRRAIWCQAIYDSTSWVGAITEIMDEKWELMIGAIKDFPVLTLTNPKICAYVG